MRNKQFSRKLSVVIVLFLAFCLNVFSQNTHAKFVSDFKDQYVKMCTEMDFSRVKNYYSDSIRMMPEFQTTLFSKENAEKYYQAFFRRFKVNTYQRNIYETLDLGSRFLELGTFSMSLSDAEESYELKGKYMNVWIVDAKGDLKLFTEAWNYDHAVEFAEKLKFSEVPSLRMALEPHLAITDNISFELAGLNALMERIISQKDGKLWSMFYADDGISFHSFSPMNMGREKLDEYYLAHAKEMPVFEKLDVRTDRIEELEGYVLEYATAIANWRMNEYSGVSTSKNIRLWKRQANGSLKIYRLIAMYDL